MHLVASVHIHICTVLFLLNLVAQIAREYTLNTLIFHILLCVSQYGEEVRRTHFSR